MLVQSGYGKLNARVGANAIERMYGPGGLSTALLGRSIPGNPPTISSPA